MKNSGLKYDTHVHTSESSGCGKIPAKKIVKLYKNENYSGLVITDHYAYSIFEDMGYKNWNQKIDLFLKGYYAAKELGEKHGLNILLGMELSFTESRNDYLVYGIDEKFLYSNRELYKIGLINFYKLIKDNENIAIFQAHPFRGYCEVSNPEFLDGVEVYNGNKRHDSNNEKALNFAKMNNLCMSSGSDFHQKEDLARGGVIFQDNPIKNKTFVKMLKNSSNIQFIKNK
jgi:predicted metal-dependent phosphoesterase TrpH